MTPVMVQEQLIEADALADAMLTESVVPETKELLEPNETPVLVQPDAGVSVDTAGLTAS